MEHRTASTILCHLPPYSFVTFSWQRSFDLSGANVSAVKFIPLSLSSTSGAPSCIATAEGSRPADFTTAVTASVNTASARCAPSSSCSQEDTGSPAAVSWTRPDSATKLGCLSMYPWGSTVFAVALTASREVTKPAMLL